nr:uncharacterized protein LOC110082381 [Pogona vitticeps]
MVVPVPPPCLSLPGSGFWPVSGGSFATTGRGGELRWLPSREIPRLLLFLLWPVPEVGSVYPLPSPNWTISRGKEGPGRLQADQAVDRSLGAWLRLPSRAQAARGSSASSQENRPKPPPKKLFLLNGRVPIHDLIGHRPATPGSQEAVLEHGSARPLWTSSGVKDKMGRWAEGLWLSSLGWGLGVSERPSWYYVGLEVPSDTADLSEGRPGCFLLEVLHYTYWVFLSILAIMVLFSARLFLRRFLSFQEAPTKPKDSPGKDPEERQLMEALHLLEAVMFKIQCHLKQREQRQQRQQHRHRLRHRQRRTDPLQLAPGPGLE